jgi:hypothetical protein
MPTKRHSPSAIWISYLGGHGLLLRSKSAVMSHHANLIHAALLPVKIDAVFKTHR